MSGSAWDVYPHMAPSATDPADEDDRRADDAQHRADRRRERYDESEAGDYTDHDSRCEAEWESGAMAYTPCGCAGRRAQAEAKRRHPDCAECRAGKGYTKPGPPHSKVHAGHCSCEGCY